jgi:oxalate decarboxylase
VGDIWCFLKDSAHTINGLGDENEYLLFFDDGNYNASCTAFMVDDWIAPTPKDILARNFGVNALVFDFLPKTDPYILPTTVSNGEVASPNGTLVAIASGIHRVE